MALTDKATPILVVTVDAMAVRECELSCLSPFPNRSCYVPGYSVPNRSCYVPPDTACPRIQRPLSDDQATVAS